MGVVAIVNPGDGPGSAVSSAYTSGIAAPHRGRHQGHRLRRDRLRRQERRHREGGHRSLEGVLSRPSAASSSTSSRTRRVTSPTTAICRSTRRRRACRSPSATRAPTPPKLHRRARHDADLRERRASVGEPRWPAGTRTTRRRTSASSRTPRTLDATFVQNARQYVGYIYLQSDSLPNPWDSLPGYFAICWPRSSKEPLTRRARGAATIPHLGARASVLAVALGLFVVGEVRERANQVHDLLALLRRSAR